MSDTPLSNKRIDSFFLGTKAVLAVQKEKDTLAIKNYTLSYAYTEATEQLQVYVNLKKVYTELDSIAYAALVTALNTLPLPDTKTLEALTVASNTAHANVLFAQSEVSKWSQVADAKHAEYQRLISLSRRKGNR
jgi:hypothetical protein